MSEHHTLTESENIVFNYNNCDNFHSCHLLTETSNNENELFYTKNTEDNSSFGYIIGRVHEALNFLTSGATGAFEALIVDLKEISLWFVRLSLSDDTYIRLHDQWQVFMCGCSTGEEDEALEMRRRRRCLGLVRVLGSLLPLAPTNRPYLRFVSPSSLSTSSDSLYAASYRSAESSVRLARVKSNADDRQYVLERTSATCDLSQRSHESGFSTAHYIDSDTSSCREHFEEESEVDAASVYSCRSIQSVAVAGTAANRKKLRKKVGGKTKKKNSADMFTFAEKESRSHTLESNLPFTNTTAIEKIKSLEDELERLKLTISQIMNKTQKVNEPVTSTCAPSSERKVSAAPPPPPPPPPPPKPCAPPPPLPPSLTAINNNAMNKPPSLQELLQSKQGGLSKIASDTTPKTQGDSWDSVISAIKGGGTKLKKVPRPESSKSKSPELSGDSYRAALTATLKARFKGFHGSEKDEDSEHEYSDSDANKGCNKWDREIWQSPPNSSTMKSPLAKFQNLLAKEKFIRSSSVKLATNCETSTDDQAVSSNSRSSCSKVLLEPSYRTPSFITPKHNKPSITEEKDNCIVSDSIEQFRKFLQSDRRKSFSVVKKTPIVESVSSSIALVPGSLSFSESNRIITEKSGLPNASPSTPILRKTERLPRALSFPISSPAPVMFGQHMLKKRSNPSHVLPASSSATNNDNTSFSAATEQAECAVNQTSEIILSGNDSDKITDSSKILDEHSQNAYTVPTNGEAEADIRCTDRVVKNGMSLFLNKVSTESVQVSHNSQCKQ